MKSWLSRTRRSLSQARSRASSSLMPRFLSSLNRPTLERSKRRALKNSELSSVARVVDRRRIARTDLAVQLDERLLDARAAVLLERRVDVLVLGVVVDVGEEGADVVVARVADRAHERRDRHLALAVDLDREDVLARGLDLEPCAPVGDELGSEEQASGRPVLAAREVHAGRAHQLRHDHALGAVDDERALRRSSWRSRP